MSSFTGSPREKAKGNGYKSLLGWFLLDTRGKIFLMKTSHWNNRPKEVEDSPTLDSFKIQLDRVPTHLSRPFFCQEMLDQRILEVFSSLVFCGSKILWYICPKKQSDQEREAQQGATQKRKTGLFYAPTMGKPKFCFPNETAWRLTL